MKKVFVCKLLLAALAVVPTNAKASTHHDICAALLARPEALEEMRAEQAKNAAEALMRYVAAAQKTILERDANVENAIVCLIAKEHMLLLGPPGIAKSMLATTVLGNILEPETGKPSFFKRVLNDESTQGDVAGQMIWSEKSASRDFSTGMLHKKTAFLDELFAARSGLFTNLLGLLNEREFADGAEIKTGAIETVFAATNRTIAELYEQMESNPTAKNKESVRAALDRFAVVAYVPGEFEHSESNDRIIRGAGRASAASKMPKLTFAEIEAIRDVAEKVEIPLGVSKFLTALTAKYKRGVGEHEQAEKQKQMKALRSGQYHLPYRATKLVSPRTIEKSAKFLRALVALDWAKSGGKTPLVATISHLERLQAFYTLGGPSDAYLEAIHKRSASIDPADQLQLRTIRLERDEFQKAYLELAQAVDELEQERGLSEVDSQIKDGPEPKSEIATKLLDELGRLTPQVLGKTTVAELTPKRVAEYVLHDRIVQSLRVVLGERAESVLQAAVNRHADALEARQQEKARAEHDAQKLAEEKRKQSLKAIVEQRRFEARRLEVEKLFAKFRDPASLAELSATVAPGDASVLHQSPVLVPGSKSVYLLVGKKLEAITRLEETGISTTLSFSSLGDELRQIWTASPSPMILAPDSNHIIGIRGNHAFVLDFNNPSNGLVNDFAISHSVDVLTRLSADGKSLYVLDRQQKRISKFDWKTGQKQVIPLVGDGLNLAQALLEVAPHSDGHNNQFKIGIKDAVNTELEASFFHVSERDQKAYLTAKGLADLYSIDLKSGKLSHVKTLFDFNDKKQLGGFIPLHLDSESETIYGYRHLAGSNGKGVQILELKLQDPDDSEIRDFKDVAVADEVHLRDGVLLKGFDLFVTASPEQGLVVFDLRGNQLVMTGFGSKQKYTRSPISFDSKLFGYTQLVADGKGGWHWGFKLNELKIDPPRL